MVAATSYNVTTTVVLLSLEGENVGGQASVSVTSKMGSSDGLTISGGNFPRHSNNTSRRQRMIIKTLTSALAGEKRRTIITIRKKTTVRMRRVGGVDRKGTQYTFTHNRIGIFF